jgi:hypothetical protein
VFVAINNYFCRNFVERVPRTGRYFVQLVPRFGRCSFRSTIISAEILCSVVVADVGNLMRQNAGNFGWRHAAHGRAPMSVPDPKQPSWDLSA